VTSKPKFARFALLRPDALLLFALLLRLAACAAGEPTSPGGNNSTGDTDGPVVLTPRSVTVEGNQHVLFRAFQSLIPGSAEVTSIEWTTTGGTISANGSFSSTQQGDFKVVGRRKGNPHNKPDTSTVIVVPSQPTLDYLILTPTSATVGLGLQQLFTVAGHLSDGTLVSVGVTWTATGGTIDPGGLYTAGQTPGTYQVTATHTTTGKTATATVTIPQATLTSVKLTPSTVSIPTNTSVQFSATGTLSNGSTTTVPVLYAATGGAISPSGYYTSGSSTGTYRVIATAQDGKADTSTVTISAPVAPPPPTTGGLWRNEDFSTYTSDEHWRSDPWGWQITAPTWFNQDGIHIDRSATYNGHPTLRYDWPAPPSGYDATYWCGKDITREAGYNVPDVPEIWVEVAHKFSPTFNVNKTGWGGDCAVGEYKFLLLWRKWTNADRFGIVDGANGHEWWGHHPNPTDETAYGTNCSGIGFVCKLGYGTAQEPYRPDVPTTPLFDGQWHVYRVHIKLPSVQGDATGVEEIWIDGKLVKRVTNQTFITRSGQFSNRIAFVALGANSNSGTSQATNTWWGHLKIWTSNPGW
jgi:hypothetical protein